MQQSDFEKRVREKMDELNFTPSPPVWPHIEERIRQKKERRRVFVWFLLLALMLGGGLWMIGERLTDDRQPITGGKVEGGKVREVEGKEVEGRRENTVFTDREADDKMVRGKKTENGKDTEREKITGESGEDTRETEAKILVQKKKEVAVRKTKTGDKSILDRDRKNARTSTERIKSDKPAADTQAVVMTPALDTPVRPQDNGNTFKETVTVTEKEAVKEPQKEPGVEELPGDTALAMEQGKQEKKTSKWTTGISVTIGVSGTGSGLRLFPMALRDNVYSSPVANPGGPVLVPPGPSSVSNGFSFGAGYVVKRNTGKRLSYSTGLRYNYYSTSIAVGARRSGSPITVSNGTGGLITTNLFYSTASSSSAPGSVHTYRNNYHFVSLPFDLEIKLGKKPLYATAGLSLHYLAASNALVYSPSAYVYYRKKEALNSFQVFGNAGMYYTFFQNKKNPVQLGPQLSYGLGRLEKGSRTYLFAAGVTARRALNKKRF